MEVDTLSSQRSKIEDSTLVYRGIQALGRGMILTQPTKFKVVGTFHVPFTQNADKPLDLRGTCEPSSEFCRLCRFFEHGNLPEYFEHRNMSDHRWDEGEES